MSVYDLAEIILLIGLLFITTPLLGGYMSKVFQGQPTFLHPILGWLEKLSYKISGINPKEEMNWKTYARSLIVFNFFGFIFLFLLEVLQKYLPLNPQGFTGVPWPLAFNTAVSFVTNTNWQSYAGETTLSYLTQMLGLTVQNFLSAATGITALLPLIRGFKRHTTQSIGNFWEDLTRSIVYLLIPLSLLLAVLLLNEGVIQNFLPYKMLNTMENGEQVIPLGPVASQEAIKLLGTNGGGFFNANSTHPFENPTGLSNFIGSLSLLLIPAALIYTYGNMIGSNKHGWLIYFVMLSLWGMGLMISYFAEQSPDPIFGNATNWEGKEMRFGISNSILWSVSTTASANGSVNTMLSSLSPLAGGVAMFNIMLGEKILGGGVGVGISVMVMFILLTVFLAGLMVGRTPEYLGKKIEKREMQWAMITLLIPGSLILIGSGISSLLPEALASIKNQGPHGLTEILYAFVSAAGNNGSSFAGLNANTNYYNLGLGTVMLIGRLSVVIPSIAIGGLLASKKTTPPSSGTFSTNSLIFAILLICVIVIMGALAFFPALALGPIVEHLLMINGKLF